jgi:spore germination protein KB
LFFQIGECVLLDKPLTRLQAIAIILMFNIGSSAVVGVVSGVGQDSWIALLMGTLFAVPVMWINSRIISLNPDEGFFEAVERLLGKVIGKLAIALMSWFALHLLSLVLRYFSEFIQITSLQETPQLPVLIIMAMVGYTLAINGGKALGKWSLAITPVVLGLVAMTVLLSFNIYKPENFLPVLDHPIGVIAKNAFQVFSLPLAETVLLLGIADFIRPCDNPQKIYLGGLLISALVFLVIMARNLMILGPAVMMVEHFPSYAAARIINVGDFLSRIEGSISVNFMLAGITKVALCLITASRGIACLFGIKDWRMLVAPVGLLAVMLAQIQFSSALEMFDFVNYYPYYTIPFEIALPVVIWAVSEIRARKSRKEEGGTGRTAGPT